MIISKCLCTTVIIVFIILIIPLVGELIVVSVSQTGAGRKEGTRFVWDGWQAPVAELEAIPALQPLGRARLSIAELWMCVNDRGSAFYLMKNKYSQSFLPPVWVAASCSQLWGLWRKQTCSCRGLRAACGAGGTARGMPAGRMAPRLPSDAKGPSGVSLRTLCSGDPEIPLGVLLAKQTLLSAEMPRWSRSAECWHSTGWARCRRCHTGRSWVQMEIKSRTVKGLEFRREAGTLE